MDSCPETTVRFVSSALASTCGFVLSWGSNASKSYKSDGSWLGLKPIERHPAVGKGARPWPDVKAYNCGLLSRHACTRMLARPGKSVWLAHIVRF